MICILKPDDRIRSFVMDEYSKQFPKKNCLTFLSMIISVQKTKGHEDRQE